MKQVTCSKKTLLNGYQALERLAKRKNEKGLSWPLRLSWPISRNLSLLRDDYAALGDAEKSKQEALVTAALELAVKDSKGAPMPRGNGYVLKDPAAYRLKERDQENEWTKLLKETVEVHVIPIKASELQDAITKEARGEKDSPNEERGFPADSEDLGWLMDLGVLEYDLDGAAAEKK